MFTKWTLFHNIVSLCADRESFEKSPALKLVVIIFYMKFEISDLNYLLPRVWVRFAKFEKKITPLKLGEGILHIKFETSDLNYLLSRVWGRFAQSEKNPPLIAPLSRGYFPHKVRNLRPRLYLLPRVWGRFAKWPYSNSPMSITYSPLDSGRFRVILKNSPLQ